MTNDDRLFIEGFTAGLTCSGINCDYKPGSPSFDKWWIAFRKAKDIQTRDAVIQQLLKFRDIS